MISQNNVYLLSKMIYNGVALRKKGRKIFTLESCFDRELTVFITICNIFQKYF